MGCEVGNGPTRLPSAATPPGGDYLGETGLLDAATKAEFDQQFRAVQVLYFAMLASLAGYLVIGLVLGSGKNAKHHSVVCPVGEDFLSS